GLPAVLVFRPRAVTADEVPMPTIEVPVMVSAAPAEPADVPTAEPIPFATDLPPEVPPPAEPAAPAAVATTPPKPAATSTAKPATTTAPKPAVTAPAATTTRPRSEKRRGGWEGSVW